MSSADAHSYCPDAASDPEERAETIPSARVAGAAAMRITSSQPYSRDLRDFLYASSDWFWEMGPDLRFSWFSNEVEERGGIPAELMLGRTRPELRTDRSDPEHWARHQADLDARRPFRDFRYRTRAKDGRAVWFSVSGIPVFDESGDFLGYRGSGCNVTAQVEAEQRAERAQQQLIGAVESITDGFALFDADDRLVLCNENYRQALAVAADLVKPGVPFRALLSALVERGAIVLPEEQHDEWLSARLDERRGEPASRSYQTSDGRWTEVHEHRTADGGRAILRLDVSDRHAADQRIRDVEARFRTAFETSAHAISISRLRDGLYVDVNGAFIEMFGLREKDVVGRTSLDIGIWQSSTQRSAFMRRLTEERRIRNHPLQLMGDSGLRTVLLSASLCTLDGEPHVVASLEDITDRRRVEIELRKLWHAVEQSSVAVIITDDDGRIEYVNPCFSKVTGYDRSEAVGRRPSLLKSGKTKEDEYRSLWSTIKTGENWAGEFCNRRKDGTFYWAAVTISPVKSEDGRISHFIGMQGDVTRRKIVEQDLRASEERFRLLVDTPLFGICIEKEGKPVFVNKTFAAIFGFRDAEEVMALPSIAALYCEQDLAVAAQDRELQARGGRQSSQLEIRGTRKDGSAIWLLTQTRSIPWNGGGSAVQWTVIDITLRKRYEERLHQQANYDPVTDLPNRTLALDRLSSALASARRRGTSVAVLYMDVDRFKRINDTLGHAAGDRFLRQVAHRAKAVVREEDTTARLAGDEFIVILPHITERTDAEIVARRILEAFATPFSLDGQELFATLSIGIAVFPEDAETSDGLMRSADAAMYVAKNSGRGIFCVFTPELQERDDNRIRLEVELRHALEDDQLSLHYQPLVDIVTGQIIGAEALLRWFSPELGLVGPETFIRLAEDTGLIIPMGEWILKTACRQLREWHDAGFAHLSMAVNVSSRQFRSASLSAAVQKALDENGLSPECLELEITESLLMDDMAAIDETLAELDAQGIRLAVDDFGTGYSSLSYINRFPLDTLKIDRSFTASLLSDEPQATLVDTLIVMAHRLKLRVVAEGVETAEQLEFLSVRGCEVAQGYYFSRPVPPAAFLELLASWPAHGAPCAPEPTVNDQR